VEDDEFAPAPEERLARHPGYRPRLRANGARRWGGVV